MSSERRDCRNCGRRTPAADLDDAGWCPDCRAIVVRRAVRVSRAAGGLAALLLGLLVFGVLHPDPRFLMVWLILIAGVYVLVSTLVRRVAFEYIRSRGVARPPEK